MDYSSSKGAADIYGHKFQNIGESLCTEEYKFLFDLIFFVVPLESMRNNFILLLYCLSWDKL